MNFKEMIEFCKQSEKMEPSSPITQELEDSIKEIETYLDDMAEKGKKLLLERMGEETLARFIRTAKVTLLASMIENGDGGFILMADATSNDLDAFIHTMILETIGALYEEEVI